MMDFYSISHGVEGVLFFIAAGFLYWRLRESEYGIRVTRLTMNVMATLGAFFVGIYVATGLFSQPMTGVLVPVVHLFVFASIAYMWKFLSAWYDTGLEKYSLFFWLLAAAGAVTGLGIYAGVLPAVAGQVLPLVLLPAGLVLGIMGFYSARQIGGADGTRIAIFATAAVDSLLISSLLNNLYLAGAISSPVPAILNNLLYGGLFLLSVFWGQVKGLEW